MSIFVCLREGSLEARTTLPTRPWSDVTKNVWPRNRHRCWTMNFYEHHESRRINWWFKSFVHVTEFIIIWCHNVNLKMLSQQWCDSRCTVHSVSCENIMHLSSCCWWLLYQCSCLCLCCSCCGNCSLFHCCMRFLILFVVLSSSFAFARFSFAVDCSNVHWCWCIRV